MHASNESMMCDVLCHGVEIERPCYYSLPMIHFCSLLITDHLQNSYVQIYSWQILAAESKPDNCGGDG